ncbi:MAG: chloride channel protein [Verrucomicrobiota bacterium]
MNWAALIKTARKFWAQAPYMVTSSLLGLVAGFTAVGFHQAMHFIFDISIFRMAESGWSMWQFAWGSLAVILSCTLISGWLLKRFAPDAAGSGIPQLKVAFWKDFGYVPLKTVIVKFVAGALTVGGGVSLGREGPTVHIAGGLASWVSGWLGVAKQKRRSAAAAGAASGLAAAFNTPLAAITFVLEEIVGDLNSRFLGGVLLASVMGALVTHAFLGKQPAFIIEHIDNVTWASYLATPLVAAVAALLGLEFQRLCLSIRKANRKIKWLPDWLKPSIGGFVTWVCGIIIFLNLHRLGVFSMGYLDLTEALRGDTLWTVALALLAAKFVATALSYGTGNCGGIFAPTLFLGGMCGAAMGGVLKNILPITESGLTVLAIVGMCACFGAVVRAPITAILMLFEMTHEFLLIPPLMLATLFSQIIARMRLKNNFYEAVIEQDGHDLKHMVPPRDIRQWQQRTVASAASFDPIVITSLEWNHVSKIFKKYPHNRFPVIINGKVKGILRRQEAEIAYQEGRIPDVLPLVWTSSRETFGELQSKLIQAACDLAIVGDEDNNHLIGVITLHDLLRDQQALLERAE